MATYTGTASNDNLAHPESLTDDIYYGLAGNDLLTGGAGNDKLYGAEGDNTLIGGAGNDQLDVFGYNGNNILQGGDGNDTLNGGSGNDVLDGGSGNDALTGYGGADKLYGGEGDDAISSGAGYDVVNKVFLPDTQGDVLNGDTGNDILTGGAGNDLLDGGLGNDKLYGNAGDNTLIGGDGDDYLSVYGYSGANNLQGGTGNDTLWGGDGNDTLDGGTGSDKLIGWYGDDIYYVDNLNDTISDIAGNDTVYVSVDGYLVPDAIEHVIFTGGAQPLPYFISALASGATWTQTTGIGATVSYSFRLTAPTDDPTKTNFLPLTEPQKTTARGAIGYWGSLGANLTFIEVADSSAVDIRFGREDTTNEKASAYAGYPPNGDVWFDSQYDFLSASWHETGHALGLKHPFEGTNTLPKTEDNVGNTLLSYTGFAGWEAKAKIFDFATIHYMYGVNPTARSGNDAYHLADRYIWDGAGIDTLDLSDQNGNATLDLTPGRWGWVGQKAESILADGQFFIGYGTQIENATGGRGNDTMTGNAASNTLKGGAGNDALDGGIGVDTANYAGKRSSFTLTKTAAGYSAADKTGAEGTDALSNIEKLQFADCSVDLSIGSKSKTINASDLKSLEELYVAFFNRVPDASGLAYWIDDFNSGTSFNAIADNFYSIALQFGSVTGYAANSTNADFIKTIYKNVLGRSGVTAPPQVDVDYWNANLLSGQFTKGTLIKTMLTAAHEYKHDATWSWMADLLDNKIAVANLFAVQQGLGYNTPEESITKGMAIAAAVTPTDVSAAIQLIGVVDSGFSLV